RRALGRIAGSASTAGIAGVLAWLVSGALTIGIIAAGLAFAFSLFGGGGGGWASGRGGSVGGGVGGGGWGGGRRRLRRAGRGGWGWGQVQRWWCHRALVSAAGLPCEM